jgi:hypothetical protein
MCSLALNLLQLQNVTIDGPNSIVRFDLSKNETGIRSRQSEQRQALQNTGIHTAKAVSDTVLP